MSGLINPRVLTTTGSGHDMPLMWDDNWFFESSPCFDFVWIWG
jgi:hypothetical protein